MLSCQTPMSKDHKKNFDNAVKKLTALRKQVQKAETLSELSKLELEVRNALMETIHCTNFLSYWMREAADKRRKEINNRDT